MPASKNPTLVKWQNIVRRLQKLLRAVTMRMNASETENIRARIGKIKS